MEEIKTIFNGGMKKNDDDELVYFASDEDFKKIKQIKQSKTILFNLVNNPQKLNPFQQLQLYREHVPILIDFVVQMSELNKSYSIEKQRLYEKSKTNKHKRWSELEDLELIELVGDGNKTLSEISIIIGRTPSSITTRISKLVGLERISQKVAGDFFGTINGKEINGEINGKIIKK